MSFNYFEWVTEGLLIFIFGVVGLFGNGVSVYTFWRQRVHRIFHNLLLSLAIFDMVSDKYKSGPVEHAEQLPTTFLLTLL